ncbi:MAG: hypothetical protein ACRERD_25640, partial [Candidatus Binatia bacterium]
VRTPATASVAGATAAPSPTADATAEAEQCAMVAGLQVAPDSENGVRLIRVLQNGIWSSQPDLATRQAQPLVDEVWAIDRLSDWVLIQASFEHSIEPGIFAIVGAPVPNHYRYVGRVWQGTARSEEEVRAAIAARTPATMLPSLIECIDVSRWVRETP